MDKPRSKKIVVGKVVRGAKKKVASDKKQKSSEVRSDGLSLFPDSRELRESGVLLGGHDKIIFGRKKRSR